MFDLNAWQLAAAVLGFIVLSRLVAAPYWIHRDISEKLRANERQSEIALKLCDGLAFEVGLRDANGKDLPRTRAFMVHAINKGDRFLRNCQVMFGFDGKQYPVCRPFDLRSGEPKDIPVLRIQDGDRGARAVVYLLDPDASDILPDGPAWLPHPGDYDIKIFSADTRPASIRVSLTADFKNGIFSNWQLAPCD